MTAAVSGILMVLMAATASMPSDSGFSTELVPGVGAGPVTLSASREDLAGVFADSVLKDTLIHMGEGYYSPGTEIMAATDLHLSVVWRDGDPSGSRRITALGPGWTAPEGVRVGMTLQEVEELAGPFRIAGFGWDYGGTADMAGTPLEGLLLRFRLPDGADIREAGVMGDCMFDSGDPGMQSVDPVLESIAVLSEEG
ncbi:MAG: hypothetical protein R6U36_01140 [Candidatus Fermentibacteraceae bacterium]